MVRIAVWILAAFFSAEMLKSIWLSLRPNSDVEPWQFAGYGILMAYTGVFLSCDHHFRKLSNREIRGCCRSCGYDLRATPARCPECGAEPFGYNG